MMTLQTGQPQQNVIMGVQKSDRAVTWISINSQPLTHPGEPLPYAVVSTFTDITARKQDADKLARSEQRYRQFFEHNSAVQLLIDPDNGQIVQASAAACQFYGYSAEQMQTLNIGDINVLHLAEQQTNMSLVVQGKSNILDLQHRLSSGEIREVTVFAGPVVIENKAYIYAIVQDVTEQRQAIKALAASEEKFRSFVEQSSDGIMLLDDEGRVVEWNAASETITGLKQEAVLGQFTWDVQYRLIPPEKKNDHTIETLKAQAQIAMLDIHAPVLSRRVEFEIYPPDGLFKYIEQIIFPVQTVTGYHLASVMRDITASKQMKQREFELALEKERVQLLRRFIEKASHEFRTPLTVINTALFFAANGESLEKRQSKTAVIEAQVWRMTRLLDMLLTMARLDNSDQRNPVPVNIGQAINDASYKTAMKYGEKPVIQWERSLASPFVLANPDDLIEALTQVIDNAYRFTPPDGTITVTTGVENGQVIVAVQDTGSGITEADLPHIFNTFWRKDEAHSTPGFGLGLPIARTIVEKFGGTLHAESTVGLGSTFTFALPIAKKNTVRIAIM